jgi:hypothetical protein
MRPDLPEVLVIKEGTSAEALGAYLQGGPMPEGAHGETYEELAARGRVPDCDCQLIQCVCPQARPHVKECRYRIALTCAVPIHCEEHGFDVCPHCDPCTCTTTRFNRTDPI